MSPQPFLAVLPSPTAPSYTVLGHFVFYKVRSNAQKFDFFKLYIECVHLYHAYSCIVHCYQERKKINILSYLILHYLILSYVIGMQ
jgi:hypothetical protein